MDTLLRITIFCNKHPCSPSNLDRIVNRPSFYIMSTVQKQIIDKVINYWYDIIDNSVFYIKGGLFMTSKILQELLKSTAFLGVLLLIGLYLRAKISLFRRFLVPASVIGGFLGLLLGPEVLGLTGYSPISPEWNKT